MYVSCKSKGSKETNHLSVIRIRNSSCNQRLSGVCTIGDRTTLVGWTSAETGISIISICLPNIVQLFRRAHQHGVTALFTRQEFKEPITPDRPLKMGLANSALVPGGFWCIDDDSRSATHVHQLTDNGIHVDTYTAGLYSVSASAQWQHSEERHLIALDQIHLRQDVSVREEGT